MQSTWIKTSSVEKFHPITQVYGICFDQHKKILIGRQNSQSEWQLPGGKPEQNESIDETIKCEMLEETNVTIKNIQLLGVQKVHFPNNPNIYEGSEFYQARIICDLEKILPLQADPSTGLVWERTFISRDEIHHYILWGDIAKQLFDDAYQLKNSVSYSKILINE